MTSIQDRGRDSNDGVQVEVAAFKAYSKNTLRGFVDFLLPAVGLKIIGATLHEREGERWIGLPARQHKDADGADKWTPVVDFTDKGARAAFQRAALEAVKQYESRDGAGR